ncbi:receptor-type tyrosine-protein phosphatase-like N isoform X2 [Esox lucius]|uniref:Receptor-type tyrosine-protein phosphatase-like N n=1 Tax=Esox lucius TaxID=8010 RepID=A0A3P8ZC77_ESOLU|nr:receptor-type tyrosine-protein phosphatase-like N isoform X2 [Esox lucius]
MGSQRLWRVLCLITVFCQMGMSSKYGCLFEKKLCPRDQSCSDDGLFGQCRLPQQERIQYEVSVTVLHKLQEVLKDLMMQGLSWQDDITQYIIGKELSRVPQTHPPSGSHDNPSSQSAETVQNAPPSEMRYSPSYRAKGEGDNLNPDLMQRYLDYMIMDPPRSSQSLHMQTLDPYSYRQQYGYQDNEERSLNSLEGGGFPHTSSHSVGKGSRTQDRDRQVLQDLVSLYLSSPTQPVSPNRGAAAPLSTSPFYQELDFPLDYTEDYISQQDVEVRKQHEQTEKKTQKDYGSLAGLDDGSLQKLALLLDHYGIDMKDLTPQQLDNLPAALKQLQMESAAVGTNTAERYRSSAASRKKITEGAMTHKVDKASISLPEQPPVPQASPDNTPAAGAPPSAEGASGKEPRPTALVKTEKQRKKGTADGKAQVQEEYGYIVTNQSHLSRYDGVRLLELLAERIHLSAGSFINISVVGPALTFRVRPNSQNLSADGVADKAVAEKNFLESETDLKILQTGVGERADGLGLPTATRIQDGSRWVFMTMVVMACVGGILVATMTVACLRRHANRLASEKLGLGPEGGSVTHQEYQDLCRQHMASKGTGSVGGSGGVAVGSGAGRGGGGTDTSRVSSVSSQFSDAPQPSPSSHSSTPSWCEEPAQSNMDISTGHMILAYMEDHLKNKDRLLKEWEALCSYQAEPSTVSVAQSESNLKKNRCPDSVPYDHSRVKMKAEMNPSRTDYINASTIIEHDPRMPAYIATQGPLSHTISDFWQMVWENGCTVIVMMTALVEDGEKQCDRYWPDEGSSLYHIYEVNLVSEHIWCNDFLVRSFYLKNVQTQETRTLTQFHFLSWPAQGIPSSTRTLLDFRRKVNKCYRGRSCPIIVHCSDGTGRTGTYILIDMVLNRMAKGVKEIDIAATLEHVRDQRPGMVRTKDQFEFALTAVAEEVNAILKALPQ